MDYQKLGYAVIDWLSDYWDTHPEVVFHPVPYEKIKCCGLSYAHDYELDVYVIEVALGQTLRDFIATVVHEMVHVKQWVTNRWWGDGEREARRLQYKLADKFWKEGLL